VEDGITVHLARELGAGTNHALGVWEVDDLAAVISWRSYGDDGWRVTLLAVDDRFRGRRYAELLKRRLIDQAADANVRLIFSSVHRANGAMVHINTKLGAAWEVDPQNPDYLLFVLVVRSANNS
jgi:GNAT superfamily N-acetyltransferase